MNDIDLIADLVRAGVSAELVGRVVNEITAAISMSAKTSADFRGKRTAEAIKYEERREADRLRKQANRVKSKVNPEANDAGSTSKTSARSSADIPRTEIAPSSLTSFSSDLFVAEKGSKTEVVARRDRGTRLPDDWTLSASLRNLAIEHGLRPAEFETEFKDFWVGVPGTRGRKCDWEATARNRIREIGKRRKINGNGNHQLTDVFDRIIDGTSGGEPEDPPMRDITPRSR
jgi:hypothetical protein